MEHRYGETWLNTRRGNDDDHDDDEWDWDDDEGSPIRRRFTGKEIDPETGLQYFGARYQDPRTSRWISSDPAGPELMVPMDDEGRLRSGYSVVEALNWYSYTSNNPVKYFDPTAKQQFLFGFRDYIRLITSYSSADPSMTVLNAALGDKSSQDAIQDAISLAVNDVTQQGLIIARIGVDSTVEFITEHGDEIAAASSVIAFATGNPITGSALAYLALSIDVTNAANNIMASDDKVNTAISEFTDLTSAYIAGQVTGKALKEAYASLPPEVLNQIQELGEFVGEELYKVLGEASNDYLD